MEKIFLQTIKEHQNIIHKISRMYRNTKEDQQDLFQEIVFQLWRAFPGFRQESKVSTWIYRIALNTAIAVYRKSKVNISLSDDLPEHADLETDISEQEELMYRALRQLNDSEKALISLYLEDYSYQEIADITGISENYVGVRLNRIKEKLKSILNQK
ncbi:RNA polymerase sigma factor [Dyadobacter pollutisoli]|uniref:Sigma-70 family RNA polymerase sigma factor n=1 Tax=Dyadobacter pollutisoli TaxID=2910158 RepID=A0A9E8NG93_9BACT|nr:sigma-70 family RNA polymerase sigma factor [Dyadobacter pollutisoli]WAC14406.1 sigma-70 family RNA polymerase sigma factor [Dyadobacter pollutisoli]